MILFTKVFIGHTWVKIVLPAIQLIARTISAEAKCKFEAGVTVIKTKINECGTETEVTPTHIVYKNEVNCVSVCV